MATLGLDAKRQSLTLEVLTSGLPLLEIPLLEIPLLEILMLERD